MSTRDRSLSLIHDFVQCVADDLGFEILHISHGNGPNNIVIQPTVKGKGPDEFTVQKFADELSTNKKYFKSLPKSLTVRVVSEKAEPLPYDTPALYPNMRYKICISF